MILTIFTDGASRGNPGPASYGFVITGEDGKVIYEEGKYIGTTTNNVAEYSAVLTALQHVTENIPSVSAVNFFADSRLVVEQLNGRFKIKNENLKRLILEIKNLEQKFARVTYTHVYREKNKIADKLANLALDNR
jgi:ribonuclease HI